MVETASETGSACSRGSGSDSGDDHASVAEQAQKRRLVIIAAVAAAFVYVVSRHISKRQKKKAVRLSCLRVQTNVFDWKLHMGEITEDDFRLMYRLTRDAFKKLLALLSPQTNAGADGPDARFERQVRRARLARNQARHHAALPRGRLHPRPQHALQDVQLDNLRVNLVDGERNQLAPGVAGELPPPQQQQGRRCRGRMPTPMSTSTTPSSCGDSWDLRRCDYIAWNGERRRVTQQAGTDKLNKWLNIDNDKQPGPKAAQNHKARREQMLAALLRAHPNHTDLRPKPAGNVDRRQTKRDQRA